MESFEDIFKLVKTYVSGKISQTAFEMWILALSPLRFEENKVVLSVKTPIQQDIISKKYNSLLSEAFESVLGFSTNIEIVVVDDDKGMPSGEEKRELFPTSSTLSGEYEYTFDTFIVGESNKFSHAASVAVATSPSGSYNPLFIYGDSGLGKTHLLFAIYNEIMKNEESKPEKKRKRIKYVKGETFTNELIDAIRKQTTNKFQQEYRKIDVLLVDDIQFIAGKEQTQQEFFHTFEALYQANKQIVLSSDRPPKEIKTLEDRLSSRFESGLLADVQSPDFETRTAIVQRKAELLGLAIPPDVVSYIAKNLKKNIRQLEGAVKKLLAYQHLTQTEPSISVAQNAIRDILNDNQPTEVTIEKIIEEVGRAFSVSPENIKSKNRSAPISGARQIAMYVMKEVTQLPLVRIGEEFGGRDHSTVVYAIKQVEKKMKADQNYKEQVTDIIKNVKEY